MDTTRIFGEDGGEDERSQRQLAFVAALAEMLAGELPRRLIIEFRSGMSVEIQLPPEE